MNPFVMNTMEGFNCHVVGYKYSHYDTEPVRRGRQPSLKDARGAISAARQQ